jgi:hypothetical protein
MAATARVADGCDVIDIDTKAEAHALLLSYPGVPANCAAI